MSKSTTEKQSNVSTAPPPYPKEFAMRAPPPTYEESQRHVVQTHNAQLLYPPIAENQYYGMTHHQQLPYVSNVAPSTTQLQFAATPSTSVEGIRAQVLTLDKRADVRTTATGAVIIPPPPPGCAATPGQLAVMQGQPVVIKQKKRSFF